MIQIAIRNTRYLLHLQNAGYDDTQSACAGHFVVLQVGFLWNRIIPLLAWPVFLSSTSLRRRCLLPVTSPAAVDVSSLFNSDSGRDSTSLRLLSYWHPGWHSLSVDEACRVNLWNNKHCFVTSVDLRLVICVKFKYNFLISSFLESNQFWLKLSK